MQQVIQTVERLIGFAKEVMINITELADLKGKDYCTTILGICLYWRKTSLEHFKEKATCGH